MAYFLEPKDKVCIEELHFSSRMRTGGTFEPILVTDLFASSYYKSYPSNSGDFGGVYCTGIHTSIH